MISFGMEKRMVHAGVLGALLAASAGVSAQTVFLETFGDTATRTTSPYVPQYSGAGAVSYYRYADPVGTTDAATANNQRAILDGFYTVVNPQNVRDTLPAATVIPAPSNNAAGTWWAAGAPGGNYRNYRDHTGDEGAVLVVNAGNTQNHMYRRLVTLTPGRTYVLSAWLYIVQAPSTTQLSLREPDDTASLGQSASFDATTTNHQWAQHSWKFTLPISCTQTQYAVAYSNLNRATSGNDLFIDDISLVETTDTAGASTATCGNATTLPPTVTTVPDSASTPQGVPVTINVTGNDSSSDPTNAPLGAPHAATPPANGSVSYASGQPVYTPNLDFTGTDTFTYEVCAAASAMYPTPVCRTETVTVTVAGVTTTPDSATTAPGTPVTIDVRANDTSPDPVNRPLGTPTTVAAPANGTVTWVDGQAVYTPNAGFQGPSDSFTYQVCTTGTPPICSAPTLVTVSVTAVPAPVPANATWALGLLSLGVLGFAARRTRRRQG